MGINGLYPQIGPGARISLAKLSVSHYTSTSRPFRLAIDIAIWLFQIQSGKGGSNPALRTFYYRLLRLLTLNIQPLFVFDGPNKPLFKRNKKVGGPGVRVANVPEFLAKQVLKQFGFPWHVAPGEAEAECALLQREGLVDAVLSEDVDTLMFGSGTTLRNWTPENSGKVPTHVNVYRADETLAKSGLDGQGMILVALMSGGDYLPDGIPGCGVKLASDAARAGFGKELCGIRAKDTAALREWRDRLAHEIHTNKSKLFTRKTPSFRMPEDFPNIEVLGYYTHPCVSTPEKLVKIKDGLKWDQPIDYAALRTFAADAFDWRCLGGAKKFIRNLAPAILVRELRLRGDLDEDLDEEAREQRESELVTAIHGKRNHVTTDGELEYRISYTPANLVPIDLSIEDEDDEFVAAGGGSGDSDAETEAPAETDLLASPTKKRIAKPYDPSQPEKIWLLKPVLQVGCPLLVECYEASLRDPKEFLKARRKAKTATSGAQSTNIHATADGGKARRGRKPKAATAQENTLDSYTRVTKAGSSHSVNTKDTRADSAARNVNNRETEETTHAIASEAGATFTLPSVRAPTALAASRSNMENSSLSAHATILDATRDDFGQPQRANDRSSRQSKRQADPERTPRTKRRSAIPSSPATAQSQRTITSFFSASPQKETAGFNSNIISLISSPIEEEAEEPQPNPLRIRNITPTPPNVRFNFRRASDRSLVQNMGSLDGANDLDWPAELPDTVTKRRPRKDGLSRSQTAPTTGVDDYFEPPNGRRSLDNEHPLTEPIDLAGVMTVDLCTPSPNDRIANQPEGRPLGTTARTLFPKPKPAASRQPSSNRGQTSGDSIQSVPELDDDEDDDNEDDLPALPFTQSRPAATSGSVPADPTIRRTSSQQLKPKPKQKIQLRESLEGAWKTVNAEEVDLTGEKSMRKTRKAWRLSTVDILDLTED